MVVLEDDAGNELETEREPDKGLLDDTLVKPSVVSGGAALLLLKSSCSTVTQLGRRFNYKK
jgi:hypothetical protein